MIINSVINKNVYNKLKNEKENLKKKIFKIKIILEDIKLRYELEITKKRWNNFIFKRIK